MSDRKIEELRRDVREADGFAERYNRSILLLKHPSLTWTDLLWLLEFEGLCAESAAMGLHNRTKTPVKDELLTEPAEWRVILSQKGIDVDSVCGAVVREGRGF